MTSQKEELIERARADGGHDVHHLKTWPAPFAAVRARLPACICRAAGCGAPRTRTQFMCPPHWRALPMPLRSQINATWRAWQHRGPGQGEQLMLDYTEACDEAKRWTAEREGKLSLFKPELPRLKGLYELRRGDA